MLRPRLLALPLAGVALFGVTHAVLASQAASNQRAAITRAALAPYREELLRDAAGLCGSLTPGAAATIVSEAEPGTSCVENVQRIFAATATEPLELPRTAVLGMSARANELRVDGQHASGVFSLVATETAERHRTQVVRILRLGSYELDLQRLGGRWLVSSPAHLVETTECVPHTLGRCRLGVEHALFVLGDPVGRVIGEAISTPRAVREAGARERHEFAAGRTVLAQSGCLACHKLGAAGNRGPGQNLTHVGARLTQRQIELAVLHPRAPMPSFRGLPPHKLRDLVRFLSLLR